MSIRELEPDLAGHGLRIGVVQARFNQDIGAGLRSGCLTELARLGVAEGDVTYATVPGALELPLTFQVMAQSGRFDALVALGAVIRGETYHFEIVSNESARGITDVQLNSGIPIANVLFAGNPALGMIVLPVLIYHQIQLIACAVIAQRYARDRR